MLRFARSGSQKSFVYQSKKGTVCPGEFKLVVFWMFSSWNLKITIVPHIRYCILFHINYFIKVCWSSALSSFIFVINTYLVSSVHCIFLYHRVRFFYHLIFFDSIPTSTYKVINSWSCLFLLMYCLDYV